MSVCWVCESPAQASCRFCGRFVCKNHTYKMPYFMSVYVGANQMPKALIVADAVWCRVCRTHPEPIEMPEIY
jgi:hypothetical protein